MEEMVVGLVVVVDEIVLKPGSTLTIVLTRA